MSKKFIMLILFAIMALLIPTRGSVAQDSSPDQPTDTTGVLGSGISYQGRLEDTAGPVNGTCDFRFSLFDASSGGNQFGSTLTRTGATVSDGYFQITQLDFGTRAFIGQQRYLKIEVRCPAGTGGYTTLTPRQEIMPAPFAVSTINLSAYNPNNPGTPNQNGASVGLNWYNDGSKDWPRIRYGGHGEGAENGLLIQGPGNATKMTILNNGNVGIGVSPTRGRLQLAAGAGQNALYLSGGATLLNASLNTKWNMTPTSSGNATLSTITNNWDSSGGFGLINGDNVVSPVVWMYSYQGNNAFTVAKKGYSGTGSDITDIDDYLTPLFQVRVNGYVGIGTTSPTHKTTIVNGSNDNVLRLIGPDGVSVGYGARINFGDADYVYLDEDADDKLTIYASGRLALMGGNVGIGTTTPGAKLDVNGTTQTDVLQITGGADFAESFNIIGAENIEPGVVVAIDPENPGQLRISDKAYDYTVAGCVSGANGINPGLIMGQEGTEADGEFPVALSGRVYCWADASNGPIQPGDLLTTSDNPGHAMKAMDYDLAQGAIIGKAMTGLDEGTGLILVLVTLQ